MADVVRSFSVTDHFAVITDGKFWNETRFRKKQRCIPLQRDVTYHYDAHISQHFPEPASLSTFVCDPLVHRPCECDGNAGSRRRVHHSYLGHLLLVSSSLRALHVTADQGSPRLPSVCSKYVALGAGAGGGAEERGEWKSMGRRVTI
jgi:hypothetical protein